ncbi:hypothetical protein OSTOST_11431, partial [Ostertagia ostertagi]
QACVRFNSRNRKHLFVIPRAEVPSDQLKFEISFEIHNVVGYRSSSSLTTDFFMPSALSDLCITFRNTPRKLYVNSQYSRSHSNLTLQNTLRIQAIVNKSPSVPDHASEVDDMSDFDVMSLRCDMTATARTTNDHSTFHWSNDILLSGIGEPGTIEASGGIFTLEDVDFEEFLMLLKAIYPPGIEITKDTLSPLISTSYRFGVEHILWRCEDYLMAEEGMLEFDLLKRLEYASLYKMATLQVFEDPPRMEMLPVTFDDASWTFTRRLKTDSIDVYYKKEATRPVAQTPNLDIPASIPKVDYPPRSPSFEKATPTTETIRTHGKKESSEEEQRNREKRESLIALRERLVKEMALRKNLELTLKCTREFIRQTTSTAALQNNSEETPSLPEVDAPMAEPESVSAMVGAPPIPPHALPIGCDFRK